MPGATASTVADTFVARGARLYLNLAGIENHMSIGEDAFTLDHYARSAYLAWAPAWSRA